MKQSSNILLIGIVIAILILIIAAFIIVLSRPAPEYRSEDSPEGIAHNYLLAIQDGDFDRAYSYLSSTIEYPADAQEFLRGVKDSPWDFNQQQDVSLVVESSSMPSENIATVTIRQSTFYNEGLFGSEPDTQTFRIFLEKENGQWRLVNADRYWHYCWGDEQSCPESLRRRP